ncbi:MAG: hypothetical protein HY660_10385 [Armatimonadetes bacterium]|nr:hypothetical protein [Armatimonadota bacterium]
MGLRSVTLVALAMTIWLAAPAGFGSAQDAGRTVVPGERLGSIAIGMVTDEVQRVMGDPAERSEDQGLWIYRLNHDGQDLDYRLGFRDGKVQWLQTNGMGWTFASGEKIIGMNWRAVFQMLGMPDDLYGVPTGFGPAVVFLYNSRGIVFVMAPAERSAEQDPIVVQLFRIFPPNTWYQSVGRVVDRDLVAGLAPGGD